ncbi:type I-F CRISPR-associated protein Csy2 [Pseudomonas oryzihabitans]|uniref:type I-F CRISPR-associated protein Csy2 n=1 Tax=Pseudomonas oryzihabitans TaxID=47885 RepID=UPI001123DB64|nr:type I-F CRISPR-associated protein Csy2 [Pseudomonas psychrotolerans]QDD90636.1 type I-F CRISPR-associated protein Csy2 [Pseudomonas psychrotolerans]
MDAPEALLLLPRLRVQNANAISGPLTWGFPAVTAFTGFVQALELKLREELDIQLAGVAIVCHHHQAQTSVPAGKRTRVFHLTRNPVGKDGATAAIVEEGRIHLDVSLLIGVSGNALYDGLLDLTAIAQRAWDIALGMRLAGGSLLPPTWALGERQRPLLEFWPGTAEEEFQLSRRLTRRLLPGFALIPRDDLLIQRTAALQAKDAGLTSLEALLDLTRLNIDPPGTEDEHGEPQADWHLRPRSGWLVPIPLGYRSLAAHPPGSVRNARDRSLPFHFVESLYGLGEWRSPHRFADIRQLLWYHQAEPDAGLYRCTTPFLDLEALA